MYIINVNDKRFKINIVTETNFFFLVFSIGNQNQQN